MLSSRKSNASVDSDNWDHPAAEPELFVCQGGSVVNTALLLMSSVVASGGDVTPVEWGMASPMVVRAGGCCGNTAPVAASCNTCGSAPRVSLLDKIKARFAPKPKCGCGCAAAPVAAPIAAPCSTCGTTSKWTQDNLFDRLKAHMAAKKSTSCNTCGSAPVIAVPGCATPGAVITPPANPPIDMPKPKDPVKDPVKPKVPGNDGASASPPVPSPITLPPLPSTPTINPPKPAGISSPY